MTTERRAWWGPKFIPHLWHNGRVWVRQEEAEVAPPHDKIACACNWKACAFEPLNQKAEIKRLQGEITALQLPVDSFARERARLRADNAALARDLELDEFPENDPRLHACSCRWAKDAEGIPTGDPIQVCDYHARLRAALTKAPCQRNDYNRWCPDRLDGFPRSDWCEPCNMRAYKEKP